MATTRINYGAKLPGLLAGAASPGRTALIDVGCSGGVDVHWMQFGEELSAVAFDPLIAEIDRLNASNTHPGIRYEAAFVGYKDWEKLFPLALKQDEVRNRNNQWFERSSAREYARVKAMNYVQEVFNRGSELVYSDRWIDIDDYVRDQRFVPDFLKIDTDGSDIVVLMGAQQTLASSVLGVEVEAQFAGEVHEYANTLPNVDRVLRQAGLNIIDLEAYRYTRAALPGRFVYDIPAQTLEGATQWGEAIYARDLADPLYEKKFPDFQITAERVLKLAAFYELYGFPDCAAELLVARRGMLESKWNVTALLDALVPPIGNGMTYEQYLAAFRADPDRLLPSRLPK